MPARSWLLPNAAVPILRTAANILWALTVAGFIFALLAFLGILLPPDLWRPLAVIFAFVSLLGLGLFWGNWGALNAIGALSMNAAILLTQLWLRWPPVDMFGR
jgi:hypothetical protein